MARSVSEACHAPGVGQDALTGLPGRGAVLHHLAGAGDAPARRCQTALLILDLDSFRTLNESLGDEAGDQLLAAVAQRLPRALPPDALLTRWGGDQFAALLPEITQSIDAVRAAESLLNSLRTPFALAGRAIEIAASIGVAVGSTQEELAGDLPHRAERALRRAKAAGGARYVIADAVDDESAQRRTTLARDLWAAVEHDEIHVYYQPNVDLRTGMIVGVEALARWQHPRLGLIYPDDFIPLAQEIGMIRSIGGRVLREACRQMCVWHARHPRAPRLGVSVNLSSPEFRNPEIIAQVAGALRDHGLNPACLQLEISEPALMDGADTSLETLQALKRLGVHLALDDFGSSCTSLRRLGHLPVTTLKIDRAFVDEMGRSAESLAVVRSVIALAHALNMDVTAEGFETESQLNRLRDASCDHGQGFYFSEPLPGAAMTELLAGVLP